MASDKPLVWLRGEVKTPPFSVASRIQAGFLMRRLQKGEQLTLPDSRPMPDLGRQCHELRVLDGEVTWRILYHLADDAIVILEVFKKKTRKTPTTVIQAARRRLSQYLRDAEARP